MPRIASVLGCALAVALGAACTAAGGVDDAGAAAMEARVGSFGVVRIDRDSEAELSGARAVLGAAFAQYRGLDGRDVLALLGSHSAEIETCRVQGMEEGAFATPDAEVELIDAGELEVRVAGTRTELFARTFPDLAGMVGGVFYAEDATLAPARADVDEYVVAASGRELPSFEVVAVAPPGLTEVLVDGAAAEDGVSIERGFDVTFEWDAGDPRDRVEIEIAAAGQVVECAARDDGSFRLDGQTLAWLGADEEARVVVSRVRTQPFDVAGLDAAWVSVASSRTLRAAVR